VEQIASVLKQAGEAPKFSVPDKGDIDHIHHRQADEFPDVCPTSRTTLSASEQVRNDSAMTIKDRLVTPEG